MHRAALWMGPSGFVAVLAGWTVTEVGRQPYTVYNLLRTADSASPIDATAIAFSLLAFVVVYFSLFGAGVYYIFRQMSHPPSASDPGLSVQEPMRAAGLAGARTGVTGQSDTGGQA
jgi:cytochrome d ubiquinol oxidase subunit I